MKRYIFAGLFVLLGLLLVSFPARVAYNWFAPPDIQLNGIAGSIWNGSATEGMAAGAYLRDIAWKLKPSSLLSGQLAFDASAKPAGGALQAAVAISLDGSLSLSDVSGNLPLDLAHPAFKQNGISGDIRLDFSSLVIRNGLPVTVDGSITIANFFASQLSPARLGDYEAVFETVNDNVVANLDDLDGVLDIVGTMTLAKDRSYALIGQVAARANAAPSTVRQLEFLGSPDENGFRPFRFEGSL